MAALFFSAATLLMMRAERLDPRKHGGPAAAPAAA